MDYIVLDLEWNQSPNGKQYSNPLLPFEIIEIGAVRLSSDPDGKLVIKDTFQRLIRPSVYHWIHNNIHDVIHVNYHDLMKGTPFPETAAEFITWCGSDFQFATWGDQDVMELQRNMNYYHQLYLLPGPVIYTDVQDIFSLRFETPDTQRSLEYAIDFLKIKKNHGFHRALDDAEFTARIMQKIEPAFISTYPSLDVYQHPGRRKEELFLDFPTCSKYVSKEFVSREKAMKDRIVTSTPCPVCKKAARRMIRWFSANTRIYYSVSICQEHKAVLGHIRFRKTDDEQYYVVKTLKTIADDEIEQIRQKQKNARMRQNKNKKA